MKKNNGVTDGAEECVSWLKNIFLNHKKFNEAVDKLWSNEWSEEDRNAINAAATIVEGKGLKDLANRLTSLRPSWKPSEHQMTILKAVKDYVGKGSGYWGEGLGSLIDDLEKLT